jgi:hypothetical protein
MNREQRRHVGENLAMTQEEIAHKIEVFARRLAMIATSSTRSHNFEKQMLVKDIKSLAEKLVWTE